MKIHWTEAALLDLQGIETYISRHSRNYAQGMIERIFGRVWQLESHALLGVVVPEYEDDSLRELLEDPFRIVYRILEDRVDVIAVVHAARRLPRGL
ncbi:MAG TPA: type II toxin-antitoxin system RelE/ParE family toxin [Pirellulales bacterium]|nr:type II toxin-antitoxin system RelE/ParE family toxin [Pirellulales bacterium]